MNMFSKREKEKSYLGSSVGAAGGSMVGSSLGAILGLTGAGVTAAAKTKDPRKAAIAALLGGVGGKFLGDSAGGAAGAAMFAPEGEGGSQAAGYGLGSLAGVGGTAAGGGALILALKRNPALLAKLGRTPGNRLKNLTAASGIGGILGGALGMQRAQKED